MPSASTSAAPALYDSPAPPSTQLIGPFSTRAMTKLAGYGALGPLAATCIGSAALVAGAVSTALVAGEKPGARPPSTSATLHSGASSSSCVALAPIPGSQHLNSGERGMLAGLCLQGGGEVVDVGLSPLDQVLLRSAYYNISNALQEEQLVAGEMLLGPLAPVRFWSCTNIILSDQVLPEEMLPGAVASPLGFQSVSSSPSLLTPFITNDILGHLLPSVQPGLVAGDAKLLAGLEPFTSTIRRSFCGMRFAGAPPSGQHLLLGVPHRRRMSSYPFAALGGGAPRRGYATATATGGENITRDEKIEEMDARLHSVQKGLEDMRRRRRHGRVALIGIMVFGGLLWHMYGDDLVKKGDETLSDFLSGRVKGALWAEVSWSNCSAAMYSVSYGLLGCSKEQQAIKAKHIKDLKKAKEELDEEVKQKRDDWHRHKREKADRFNRSRPANESPVLRCIAWVGFCMHDEESKRMRADLWESRRRAEIRAKAIRNQEEEEEEKKKKEEEEKIKRKEEDAERRRNKSLAEIRARTIRYWEKKEKEEEKKKKREEEKKKREEKK